MADPGADSPFELLVHLELNAVVARDGADRMRFADRCGTFEHTGLNRPDSSNRRSLVDDRTPRWITFQSTASTLRQPRLERVLGIRVRAHMLRRQFIKSMAVWPVLSGLVQLKSKGTQPIGQLDGISSPEFERAPRFGDGRDWWFHHRFGLFIHWGLYSIHGWHEQEQWRGRVPRSNYVQLAKQWNPTRFDPDQWLDAAQQAGMSYVCFTTKHHDGFCLWNTQLTDYNCLNTPYGRDVLEQLAEACHRRRVPLCLYYSIADAYLHRSNIQCTQRQ